VNQHSEDWDQAQYWERHAANPAGSFDDTEPVAGVGRLIRTGGRSAWTRRTTIFAAGVGAVVLGVIVSTALGGSPPRPAAAPEVTTALTFPDQHAVVPSTGQPTASSTPTAEPTESSTPTAAAPSATAKRPTPARTTPPAPRTSPAAPTGSAAGVVVRVVSQASGEAFGAAPGSTGPGAAVVQLGPGTGSAASWRLVAAPAGCFALVNVGTGLALDNTDGSDEDGTPVQQRPFVAGDTNQAWCFQPVGAGLFSISNLTAGSLLDLRDGDLAEGTPIQLWSADPDDPDLNQTWRLLVVS
jgi:Ricin-type beta-trefoil lectin domain-like